MIEVGYLKKDGTEVIYKTGLNAPQANAAVAELKESLYSSEDVYTLFMQLDFGLGMNRYGYIDP